jgi:hypothetical protein
MRCAAALCERLRKQLTARFRGLDGARGIGRLLWQLSHGMLGNGAAAWPQSTYPGQGALGNARPLLEFVEFSTFATWIALLSQAAPADAAAEAIADSDKEVLFLALDSDGDGYISPADLFRGLRDEPYEVRQQVFDRPQLLDKMFGSLAGSPKSNAIEWGKVNMPKDLLELLGSATAGSQALSRQEFTDYYLNCGMSLGDRDFKALLTFDWPTATGKPLGKVSSTAMLSAGVGESRQGRDRAGPFLAESLRPARPASAGPVRPAPVGPYGQFGRKSQAGRAAGLSSGMSVYL